MHRQAHRTAGGTAAPVHEGAARKISIGVISGKRRIAHQVTDLLLQVALSIEAKMFRSNMVAPLDAPLRIQQHYAIGRSLDGRQKFLQPSFGIQHFLLCLAQPAAGTVSKLTPPALHVRSLRRLAGAQPAHHAQAAHSIQQHPKNTGQYDTDQRT